MLEEPIEYKVLILPDQVSDKTESGLLVKADQTVWEETRAQVLGTVIAKSEMAFTDGAGKSWPCAIPQVGEKVRFAMYSGVMTDKIEGKFYRYMNDKDIVAIVKETP